MKKAKKSTTYEPTIADVLEVVQAGFVRTDKMFAVLHEWQGNLKEQVKDIDRRLINTQNRVEDIADSLGDITRVADKDRVSTFDHERRIRHLEKSRA